MASPELNQPALYFVQWTQALNGYLKRHGVRIEIGPGLGLLLLTLVIVLLCFLVDWLVKKLLLKILRPIIRKSRYHWDDLALKKRVFHRMAHFASATVIYLSAPLYQLSHFAWGDSLAELIRRGSQVYMVLIGAFVADALLNTMAGTYRRLDVSKQKPIRSYVQVLKILLIIVAGILILSVILNKSPWAFLTGIGAMTAIVLLVFKDTILGFVASVQMNAYDMVRPGDWIEMPKFGADGDVVEISLNTVKVQNWDKTIVTIPTAAFLDNSIKNWRGMSDSGGRRIKRHLNIDMNTIKFCDDEMIRRFSKIHYISEYLQEKIKEVQAYNQEKKVDTSTLVNGRHLTNLGTFRAYVEAYLRHHPKIHQDMTFLIRQLQPTPEGLPLEIYVFTNDTRWAHYEAIQADIFDHILAVVSLFDLQVFQDTSGQNYKIDIVSMPKVS